MDILSSAVLGGVIWDGIKTLGMLTVDHLKKALKQWVLKQEEYETIVKIINDADPQFKKTEKFLIAYVDDNKEINKILESVNLKHNNGTTVNQTVYTNSGTIIGNIENYNGERVEKK